ncbi:MAG: glycosyltransferase family 2 protein [Bacteroidales bacterium]|nr:glycosyltransferase family 2 protein [Bacteroidales bacterium]
MEKLSVLIPTKNEEIHIEAVLQSVAFADEIIVVDSFSTDNTVELAKKYTDKVWIHEYKNSGAQKNWAIPQCSHEWILVVDADERISPELQKEIQAILSSDTQYVAFWIGRINHFMGKLIRYSGWQGDAVIRLFRKSKCRYQDLEVHSEVETSGKVGRLKNKLVHYTYKNWPDYQQKMNQYTTWGANDRVNKVKNVTLFHLAIKPMYRFFRHYILRAGFLDGKHGFVVSALSAYNVFMRNLKLWRIKQGEQID